MNNDHVQQHNYRPRSPDLSAFSPPPAPQLSRLPSYPQQYPDPKFPAGYSFSPRGSYDASPFFSPTNAQAPSYFGNQPHQLPLASSPREYQVQPFPSQFPNAPQYPYSAQQAPPFFGQPFQPQSPDMPRVTRNSAMQGAVPTMPTPMPVSVLEPAQPEPESSILHIDVRTKFPVARIKRIMQADEDVGKVAQATPTAVAKALELYMIALVQKGAIVAKSQNSKKITATHLKSALMNDDKFDFLKEICEACPDEGTKKGRAKSEAQSESSDAETEAPKKKGRGAGKRKKEEDSD